MKAQVTDIFIPDNCVDVVIFVHGFGVQWDSRGMFTDIRNALPESWGSALFDFYQTEGVHIHIPSLMAQIERLTYIIDTVSSQAPKARLHIVAHSMGCIVTAIAKPNVAGEVIFLAPPERFSGKMKEYFSNYPGAHQQGSELVVPRKDGTITHIPLRFFEETDVVEPQVALRSYSKLHSIHLLHATQDEVLKEVQYTSLQEDSSISITKISADHNFTGAERAKLLKYIQNILK